MSRLSAAISRWKTRAALIWCAAAMCWSICRNPWICCGSSANIAIKADATVCFEVPNGLFTLDRLGIWDIIHEHVSYFTPSSLVRAFHSAGFTVCCTEAAFDDQYLWLEACVDGQAFPIDPPKRPPDALYSSFSQRFPKELHCGVSASRNCDPIAGMS